MHRTHLVAVLFEKMGDQRRQTLIVFTNRTLPKPRLSLNASLPPLCEVVGVWRLHGAGVLFQAAKTALFGPFLVMFHTLKSF